MSSVPVSGRLKLSPKAEQSFQQAKKVHGGQTRFLEQAVEHFVIGPQTFEKKLNNIESLVCLLAEKHGIELHKLSDDDQQALDHLRWAITRSRA
ncbi:hypothetical protein RB298_04810 [Priestia sp. BR_2]